MGEIEIEDLIREMDLENLSETRCRRIYGAHVYAEIANLSSLVSTMADKAKRQRVVQAVHIFQREVARIADAVEAVQIHFQGARAHLLAYRPVRNSEKLANKGVLMQRMVDRYGVIFSNEFSDLPDLRIRSGADMGEAIGTRNGTAGNRELLFLGAPANHAAKLLNDGADRRLTKALEEAVSDDLAACVEADNGHFKIRRPTQEELANLLDAHHVDWSAAGAQERLDADIDQFPAGKAGLYGATDRVDFDPLSFTHSKLVEAATVYGDVSGFTAYVDGLTDDGDRREALRAFHAIRREMARVITVDYKGTRVQYQGDRVQAIFNMPIGDADGFSSEAVDAAIGLQSSFELVLKRLLPQIQVLGIAAGVSQGTTIAARLGKRAHRDRICLGDEVLRAERNEEHVEKQEIGISGNVREHVDDNLAARFVWNEAKGCYVVKSLNHEQLTNERDARAYREGKSVYITPTATGPVVSTRPEPRAREVRPSSNWSR